jgi:hypothetical protein
MPFAGSDWWVYGCVLYPAKNLNRFEGKWIFTVKDW